MSIIDMSSLNTEQSPARKRIRCDPSLLNEIEETENWRIQKWSLLNKEVLLDTTVDVGIGPLESDSDDPATEDTYSSLLDIPLSPAATVFDKKDEKIAHIMQNTMSQDLVNSFSFKLKESNELLVHKPKRDIIFQINHFEDLCDEIILYIFRCLPKNSLVNAALVCHRWYQLAQDESLWSRMDLSNRYLEAGAVGHVLSRQVLILRLSGSEICSPAIPQYVPASLPEFKSRLLYLDLSMATVSSSSLTLLFSKCYRLKKLSLEHVAIDDNVLKELSHNNDLEVLNLAMVEGLTRLGIGYLLPNCPKLKELNVAWTSLNAVCIQYLCAHLPSSVDRLNISGCRQQISDENIIELVASCPNLRELDLSDCTGLTGHTVPCLIHLQGLNFLALSRCYFIPHRSLLTLKHMKSLTYLDIYGGHIEVEELEQIQESFGSNININKFKFSSVARPTVGQNRGTIWGLRVKD